MPGWAESPSSCAFSWGFTLFGPKSGAYSVAATADFVGQSATGIAISIYLFVAATIGLVLLMSCLSEAYLVDVRHKRIAWGTSLLAAVAVTIGWGLYLAPWTAVNAGGPAIDPGVSYALISAGFIILFGVSGILLGVALLTLAIGGQAAPTWVRVSSGLAGLSAVSSWGFLVVGHWSPNQWLPVPYYFVVLWGLAIGVWLLSSPSRTDAPPTT